MVYQETSHFPNKQILIKQEDIEITEENIGIAKELYSFAKKLKGCAGLAITQVGIDKRICVIVDNDWNMIMLNPEILDYSGKTDFKTERCLSWPGKEFSIKRFKKIKIKYIDENKKEIVKNCSGWLAQIIQHEIDHLNGVEEK